MDELDNILERCVRELTFVFIRAAGPGGQNVNKVATAAQLRFDVRASQVLPEAVKTRLTHLSGKRMTNDGVLMIEARRYRTQDQNREDAIARFEVLVRKSFEKPKHRWKTKPSYASKEKRLLSKKMRGEIKRKRQTRTFD
jgi:ribosome-associated protein